MKISKFQKLDSFIKNQNKLLDGNLFGKERMKK